MDVYKELLDFKAYEKKIPCPLCDKESSMTILGNHFKCGQCDHLFNQNNSPLPEGVECHCEVCLHNKPEIKELDTRLLSKVTKKIASAKKKLKRKKK